MKHLSSLATLLKERREELNLSQLKVANRVGYDYAQNISFYENDKRRLPTAKFKAMAKVLDMDIQVLIRAYFEDLESEITNQRGV